MGAALIAVAGNRIRAVESLLERFRVADATAADRARSLSQLGLMPDAPGLAQFAQAGVIRQTNTDRFYLDEAALAVYRRQQQPRAVIAAIAIGLLAMLAGLIFAISARPHR